MIKDNDKYNVYGGVTNGRI